MEDMTVSLEERRQSPGRMSPTTTARPNSALASVNATATVSPSRMPSASALPIPTMKSISGETPR